MSKKPKQPPTPADDTDELDDMFPAPSVESDDMQREIVHELLSNQDLEKKTELGKPIAWAALRTIRVFLKTHNLIYSAGILRGFTKTAFKYLISKDRKSRAEYIEALKSVRETADAEMDEGGVDLAHPR